MRDGPDVYVFCVFFFFFNDTATTEIYTLSLHDALPISPGSARPLETSRVALGWSGATSVTVPSTSARPSKASAFGRSEEHTSELQSRQYLVCRLLLEKKKNPHKTDIDAAIDTLSTALYA